MRNMLAVLATGVLLLALTLPSHAQVQVGDHTNLNLSGNLAFGYNGDFSNYAGSDHGVNGAGNADLNGYYYAPGFLSFDVQPFYNQSRANSTLQSVFQSSGVGANASIFSGSNFPGSVTYAKYFNSEGGLAVPELGSITTHGNNQTLTVGWGIRVPDLPKVSLQFTDGSSNNEVFGAKSESSSHADTFAVNVSHTLAGFYLNGGYQYSTQHSVIPEFLVGEGPQTSDSSGGSFNVEAGHNLPLHGAFSAGFTRSDITSSYGGGENFNTIIDTANAGASFQPISNLNLGVNTQYTTNLSGSLYQSFITSGGAVPPALLQYTTDALGITGQASYALPAQHLHFEAIANRQQQSVLGTSISSTSFHEMVNYGNYILGGFFNATAGVTETSVDATSRPTTVGFFDNVTYSHRLKGWDLTGGFNYSRDTETALISYTSTGYGYSANIGRRLSRHSHWNVTATGAKTTFNNGLGGDNFNQSYSTSLSLRFFSISGSYARANGISILTPAGLTPVTTPIVGLTPAELLSFGGKSYSVGASTTPIRGLTISGAYSKALSTTLGGTAAASRNNTEQTYAQLQYKLRQLWITAGYLRLVQGFSIIGGPPTSGSSFFVGVSRWFKFF
jgi:hypothetical protein